MFRGQLLACLFACSLLRDGRSQVPLGLKKTDKNHFLKTKGSKIMIRNLIKLSAFAVSCCVAWLLSDGGSRRRAGPDMRNWYSFRAALIGALFAGSACTAHNQSAVTGDRAVQPAASTSTASAFSLRVSSEHTVRAEHYEVPSDYDSDVAMHPYTSGLGPCPHGGPEKVVCGDLIPPSNYNH